jgi:ABC-type uncharacterized transport system substrate-binding protein
MRSRARCRESGHAKLASMANVVIQDTALGVPQRHLDAAAATGRAKPGALAIEQATRFELVLNMKSAQALGIRIPQSVMLRADSVVE